MIKNKTVFCFFCSVLASSFSAQEASAAITNSSEGARVENSGRLPRALPKKLKAAKSKKVGSLLAQVQPAQDFVVILKKPLRAKR